MYIHVHVYLPSLHQGTQHHNHSTLPIIDHLPEISNSGLHGTLGYDEGPLLLVSLYVCVGKIHSHFIDIT